MASTSTKFGTLSISPSNANLNKSPYGSTRYSATKKNPLSPITFQAPTPEKASAMNYQSVTTTHGAYLSPMKYDSAAMLKV
jgi:hypothetical protein